MKTYAQTTISRLYVLHRLLRRKNVLIENKRKAEKELSSIDSSIQAHAQKIGIIQPVVGTAKDKFSNLVEETVGENPGQTATEISKVVGRVYSQVWIFLNCNPRKFKKVGQRYYLIRK